MPVYIPTYDMVIEIHDMVLEVSGGRKGVHVENDIRRAVERPLTYTAYVEDYDIDTICAVLIDSIARYHGFNDGNKRTALMTAMLTYRINGIHFKSTIKMNKNFDALVMWVVKKKPDIPAIEKRLRILKERHCTDSEQSVINLVISFIKMRVRKELKKKS